MNGHRTVFTRRRQLGWLAAGTTAPAALAACGVSAGQPSGGTKTSELAGSFDLLYQTWAVGDVYHKQAVEAFQRKYPRTTVSLIPVGYGDLAPKVRTSIAAGSGPDGLQTYTGFWRGTNAATIMLPLTPTLFKRSELEQITFPNLLNAVWAKNNEVYVLPHSVGMNGSMLVYNAKLLADATVDPKSLTTLDAIVAAANKLVVRESGNVSRAGVLPTSTTNLVMR